LDDGADDGEEASRARASRHIDTVHDLVVGLRRNRCRAVGDHRRLIEEWRVDKAHFSPQHIDELRESVNPGAPQKLAELGWLPYRADLSRYGHGRAKVQHQELSPTSAEVGAPLQNRSWAFQSDRHRRDKHQWQCERQQDAGN